MADRLDLAEEVRALLEVKLREFVTFCAAEWTLTEKDLAEFHGEQEPGFREGYNTAMTDGLDGPLAHWLGEND